MSFRKLALISSMLISSSVVFVAPQVASASPGGWGILNVPNVSNSDNVNDFGVDGSGNIYSIPTDSGILKYSPTTGSTVTLDPTTDFYNANSFVVDAQGNIFVAMGSTIYEVSAAGVQSTVESGAIVNPGGMAVDGAGNLYVLSNGEGTTFYKITAGVVSQLPGFEWNYLNSIAVGPNGNLYATHYSSFGPAVYQITTSGVISTIGSNWGSPESVAVDASGNVYVADEHALTVTEVTPGGSQFLLPALPTGIFNGRPNLDEVLFAAGNLYLWAENSDTQLFVLNSSPSRPTFVNAQSTLETINGSRSQTITATWNPGAGATSYVCTLMLAFNSPSTFVQRTTGTSCSFGGLDVATEYGINLTAYNSSGSSVTTTVFASPPPLPVLKRTITCIKIGGTMLRRVTAVNPRCPVGYRVRR